MSDLFELYAEHLQGLLTRHRQLMQQNAIDWLIIPSGEAIRVYLDDMHYPFKSSFLFRSYVPLTELAQSYLIIGLKAKPSLIVYQPQDYWHASAEAVDNRWAKHFNVMTISDQSQLQQHLPQNSKTVAVLGQATAITKSLTEAQRNPQALINALYWQRAYKSAYEIACMQIANDRAAICHNAAEMAFRNGESEQQIHFAYLQAGDMLEHQLPYSNIVALNQHAAILHYTKCKAQPPQSVKSLLIDAGSSFNGYHSDITRTYAYSPDEFADLIEAMDEMQRTCIDNIQLGQSYVDLHTQAHLKIAEIIKQFNFVDMSAQAMLETGISNAFFPHGLGHFIGLQVHDVGGQFADISGAVNAPPAEHPFLRTTRVIEENMVFTIEPGLYFIESLLTQQRKGKHSKVFNWTKIESMMIYGGIRIEDDVVVEKNNLRNLTRDAFAKI